MTRLWSAGRPPPSLSPLPPHTGGWTAVLGAKDGARTHSHRSATCFPFVSTAYALKELKWSTSHRKFVFRARKPPVSACRAVSIRFLGVYAKFHRSGRFSVVQKRPRETLIVSNGGLCLCCFGGLLGVAEVFFEFLASGVFRSFLFVWVFGILGCVGCFGGVLVVLEVCLSSEVFVCLFRWRVLGCGLFGRPSTMGPKSARGHPASASCGQIRPKFGGAWPCPSGSQIRQRKEGLTV